MSVKDNELVVVAIDGPSASGKSTVSKRVALELGLNYVDSGALYRGMTWQALRRNADVREAGQVIEVMERSKWEFFIEDRALMFRIDSVVPREELRGEPVRESVADVAVIPEVRRFIVERLREAVRFGSLVMEGRDIGSVVFPETPWKFYLDADPEERARRRALELQQTEGTGDVQSVMSSLQRRDLKDTTRKTAPLQIPLGASVINSTAMSIEQVVAFIVERVRGS